MQLIGSQVAAAVLFDLDGTLADTAPDLAGAINVMRVARDMEVMPVSALRGFASMGARGLIGAGFGLSPDAAGFEALRDEFLRIYERSICVQTRLFDGMAEVLAQLDAAGLPWGIVSNKAERYVRPILEQLGLAERSGCALGGDSTPTPKPHPAPLLLGARLLKVDASACIYVGDDLRDIEAGRAAGMGTIAAAYGYCGDRQPPEQWGADHLVGHARELLALLPRQTG